MTETEAMSVDDSAAAPAGGNNVHFLITNTGGKALPSCRLTIPKTHLENLPSSYLAAVSSERWAGNSTDRGTAASPFTVSVMDCPPEIRDVWDKYCHSAPDLGQLILKAYARASASATEQTHIVLPYGMELEDADHFLRYYGLVPANKDIADWLQVPSNGPTAVYLRSLLFPAEAKQVKTMRNCIVRYLANNPERITYFVCCESSDEVSIIPKNNAVCGASIVALRKRMNSGGRFYGDILGNSTLRDKLVNHLIEEDKLEAEFVDEPVLMLKLDGTPIPDGKTDQHTLVAVDIESPDPREEEYWQGEDYEMWDEDDHRILRWRCVLKVRIPDS